MTTALGRRLWIIVGGALVLTAVLVFLSGRGSTARVAVADVVRENLSSMVSSNGKVEPVAPRSFRAGFPTFVERVYAVEGQQVKRGQLLFALDDTEISRATRAGSRRSCRRKKKRCAWQKRAARRARSAKAAADLQKAQASRDQLRRDNESLTKLVAEKAATPQELEQNRLMLTQAEADVQSLEKVKADLGTAGATGSASASRCWWNTRKRKSSDLEEKVSFGARDRPVRRHAVLSADSSGDFVKEGDLLAEIADLHHVRVRAFIDEPELGQIEVDQPVEIFWDAHPDRVWNGRTEVLPKQVVNRGTRSVGELLCSVSNDQLDLLPNTTVDVRIQVSERPNVLVVPRGAVYIEGSKRFVFRRGE